MMVTKKVLIFFGGINRDLIVLADRFPNDGETITGTHYFREFGGKAANQAVMCKKLALDSLRVVFIGKVGNDENGEAYKSHLEKCGIDISYVLTAEEHIPTGVASIFVNISTGENRIITVPGANTTFTGNDIERLEPVIKDAKFLVVTLESNLDATSAVLKIAKRNNVTTILNAAPASSDMNPYIYEWIDILCVNKGEAKVIANKVSNDVNTSDTKIEELLEILIKTFPTVIITLGEQGVAFATKINPNPKKIEIPIIDGFNVIDTTGAGDAFIGSLVFFMAEFAELGMETIVERSCFLACLSVQKEGTQTSYPNKEELPQWLFEN